MALSTHIGQSHAYRISSYSW